MQRGDIVLHKRLAKTVLAGTAAALQTKYFGPYIIHKVFSGTMVKIQNLWTGKLKITSIDYLKPYFPNFYEFNFPAKWDKYIKPLLNSTPALKAKVLKAKN